MFVKTMRQIIIRRYAEMTAIICGVTAVLVGIFVYAELPE